MCRLLREEPLVYFYKIIILKYRWNVEKGRKKEGRKEGRKESFLLDDREDIEIDRWSKLAIFQGCTIAKPWPSPELSSRKGQMWQTFTSYLHLPRLRPCFPDRVCSANGIERGRLSFFASSSAHASVIYFSLSLRFPRISPPESWEIESRYRVTKEFLRLTSLFHYFVTIRQWEFFLLWNEKDYFRNVPRIFSSSFLSFKISR